MHRGTQPETILRKKIEAALGALPGVIVWRNEVGSAIQPSGARVAYGVGGVGAPDLLVEVQGADGRWACLWLEVKTPDGALRPEQRTWHEAAHRLGRHVFVVRSVADAVAAVAAVAGVPR